jgi:hypothetical protein
MLDGVDARPVGAGWEARLADDVSALVSAFADRIEQIVIDLGEAVDETFGARPGGLRPRAARTSRQAIASNTKARIAPT